MTYNEDNRCVFCGEHFAEAHQPTCFSFHMQHFLPPTEQEVRTSIEKILRQRASAACYWKEEFENRKMFESAEHMRTIEETWNEAADIALGIRKE